ncbi:MAG TPA: 50S ribosomal protein L29 [Patescibacteria group bacterium]|nr:50S ribosomal protein L29 [Patescibacteria group bacterium]
MKIKELKDLRIKEVKDLYTLVAKKEVEVIKNAVKISGAKEKNLKLLKIAKKEIAQILTIIKEKEKQINK